MLDAMLCGLYSQEEPHQVMEDVPLVEVDGDEGLKLPAVNLGEVLCGDIDEGVQNV